MSERRIHVLHRKAEDAAPASSPAPAPGYDDADLARVARFLERLVGARYFGKLTLSFQNGKITDLRTEQSMKIDEL